MAAYYILVINELVCPLARFSFSFLLFVLTRDYLVNDQSVESTLVSSAHITMADSCDVTHKGFPGGIPILTVHHLKRPYVPILHLNLMSHLNLISSTYIRKCAQQSAPVATSIPSMTISCPGLLCWQVKSGSVGSISIPWQYSLFN